MSPKVASGAPKVAAPREREKLEREYEVLPSRDAPQSAKEEILASEGQKRSLEIYVYITNLFLLISR